jgi:hypothetical protein
MINALERIAELEAELLTAKMALLVTARERQELEAERDKLLATILEQEAEIFRLATIVQELTE